MLNDLLKSMRFRNLGPARGGRVVAVAGDPTRPAVFYFGAVAGGVFKTTDAGTTWVNVSDGFFKTAAVGALAVAPSAANVVYAGTGETSIRIDVSHGDGVYKSSDAGRTWKHCGLDDTRHIGKIVVHPANPDLVYVAALGHAFGPNEERGVYRSRDGGASWQKTLFKSENAGAVDITLDPQNPGILYASIWQARRSFWELSSGGPDCGLWKSSDGGDTWTDISRNHGLPAGLLGKIGVSASPAMAGRVWAIIESKDAPGLYRSDDFGETWQLINAKAELRRRPFYYMHVHADPVDAETVYINNMAFHRSVDGGKTFSAIPTPHGDNHALWIDPRDNTRMIQGNDGGACVSFNGGASFTSIINQLTSQFYRIDVDNAFPYRVYATQQDNSSIAVPNDTSGGIVTWGDCFVAGTGESGFIAAKPDDPNIVIVGSVGSAPGGMGALEKYDHRTRQVQLINVWPQPYGGLEPSTFKYRFPWTFPVLFSPHDPNTLYACANVAFTSTDLGHSWAQISPDLTRAEPDTLRMSGGPITADTTGAEHYASIATFRESALERGLFWAGSDDGLANLSRDGGATWQNVTPPDLPAGSLISVIEPSPLNAGAAYLTATRYKLDDNTPFVFRTRDFGATWEAIVTGIPADDFCRVIRADPACPGLLFLGTETGLYVSLDDGDAWQRWSEAIPVVPVYDLFVKDDDLVVATHGRGLWVLDDLSALREFAGSGDRQDGPRLFGPGRTYRVIPFLFAPYSAEEGKSYSAGFGASATTVTRKLPSGELRRDYLDAGAGRERGAILYYRLSEPAPDLSLEIFDAGGNLIRACKPKPDGYDKLDDKQKSLDSGPWVAAGAGIHRFVWNMRYAGATRVAGNTTAPEVLDGPLVAPGRYRAVLRSGGRATEAAIEIVNDPRSGSAQADLEAQRDTLLAMRDKVGAAHAAVNRLRDLRDQVAFWKTRSAADADASGQCAAITAKLDAIEDELIHPGDQQDALWLLNRERLNAAIGSLMSVVASADSKPTVSSLAVFGELAARVDAQLAALNAVIADDVPRLNAAIATLGAPAVC